MIREIAAVYFSGTGNTEKIVMTAAEEAAAVLGVPVTATDITAPHMRERKLEFTEDQLVFAGFPVIAGRIPNLLLPYLNTIEGNGAFCVPVVVYGNRAFDNSAAELARITDRCGFVVKAAGAFVGRHSFSDIIAAGRPDDYDLHCAATLGREAAGLCRPEYEDIVLDITALPGGDMKKWEYYKPKDSNGNHIDIRRVKPVTDTEKCRKCGTCAQVCPLGSISCENPEKVAGICMKCCACIRKCPENARCFDDEGFLYHKKDLEDRYGKVRRPSVLFLP